MGTQPLESVMPVPQQGDPAAQLPAPVQPRPRKKPVFKPQQPGETQGRVLRRMLWEGRQVAERERTRWLANRNMYRGEQYLRISGNTVRTLAPTEKLPGNIRRVTINRLRPFVDSHVSLLTFQRPPFVVESKRKDMQAIEGARVATKLVDSCWGPDEWDVDAFGRRALLYAHQDGVAIGKVYYDRYRGETVKVMRDNMTGQIVTKSTDMAALREQDPLGLQLWSYDEVGRGEVVLEVLRIGSLSIDPFATQSMEDAEWVIETKTVARHVIEREAGKKVAELIRESKGYQGIDPGKGENTGDSKSLSTSVDDMTGEEIALSQATAITVREAFIKPTGEFGNFPRGAHVKWIDVAPEAPIVEEEWFDRRIPYRALVPRPDGTHWIKSRGFVDDLAPIQVAFNRTVSMLHEWIDLVGRPPLIIQNGVLRSKSVFNEQRIVHVNGGSTPPFFMGVPSEPTAVFTNHLMFLLEQMKEITAQQDATRGQAPGRGIEASVSLNMLVEQNEQQVSGISAEYKGFMEGAISDALQCIEDNYIIPRLLAGPAGEDPAEFRDFVGSRLQGATNFRITGSITPKLRAAQIDTIVSLAQYAKIDLTPWVAHIVEGNPDEIIKSERAQEQKQKREIDQILALALDQNRDQLWQDYQEVMTAYTIRLMALAKSQGPVAKSVLKQFGANPPKLADVGVEGMPEVEDHHRHAEHVMTLDEFMISPAYDKLHPLVKQGLMEHRAEHLQRMAQQLNAVAVQGGAGMEAQAPGGPGAEDTTQEDSGGSGAGQQ